MKISKASLGPILLVLKKNSVIEFQVIRALQDKVTVPRYEIIGFRGIFTQNKIFIKTEVILISERSPP